MRGSLTTAHHLHTPPNVVRWTMSDPRARLERRFAQKSGAQREGPSTMVLTGNSHEGAVEIRIEVRSEARGPGRWVRSDICYGATGGGERCAKGYGHSFRVKRICNGGRTWGRGKRHPEHLPGNIGTRQDGPWCEGSGSDWGGGGPGDGVG